MGKYSGFLIAYRRSIVDYFSYPVSGYIIGDFFDAFNALRAVSTEVNKLSVACC